MIMFVRNKSIFDSRCQTLICPVNTVGTMGNGLALAFSLRYEGLLEAYKKACDESVFEDKGIFIHDYKEGVKILCLPTKRDWRLPSKAQWIDDALGVIVRDYERLGITSLAIPALGCGKGKLEWSDVRPLILKHFKDLPLKVTVFEPY